MRLLPFILLFLSSCSHSIYVVRHAEKAPAGPNMNSDVPLSVPGQQRAEDLMNVLKDKKISIVYSTQTVRTVSTATPTADHFGVAIELYGPRPDSIFISKLLSHKKNLLVVGHSNTVDDIVNMLCGATKVAGDLGDKEYDNLYEVKVKGKKKIFVGRKFGAKSE
ncbi:MAG: histidine phosphatase family protein [Chitinophagales bacterium]|mgnify:CR=1 FL=1|nr:histidine phosphatase family protein [Chitinophagales bacterium]